MRVKGVALSRFVVVKRVKRVSRERRKDGRKDSQQGGTLSLFQRTLMTNTNERLLWNVKKQEIPFRKWSPQNALYLIPLPTHRISLPHPHPPTLVLSSYSIAQKGVFSLHSALRAIYDILPLQTLSPSSRRMIVQSRRKAVSSRYRNHKSLLSLRHGTEWYAPSH